MTRPFEERRVAWTKEKPDLVGGYREDPRIDIGSILRAIRRQMLLVAICAGIGIVFAVLMILGSVPRYTAVETVLLDEERADLLNEISPLPNATRSDTAIQSEIQIIRSRALALQVVDLLNLEEDEDFMSPPIGATQRVTRAIGDLTDPIARLLSPPPPEPVTTGGQDGQADGPTDGASGATFDFTETDRDRAASLLRDRLSVSRSGRSLVIEIGYRGYNPERAARIARGYGTAYESFQLETTTAVAGSAEEWLRERLEVLERQSLEAAARVQEFRVENDLLQARGNLLTEQQQSELASELVSAAAAAAEAEARLESMEMLVARAADGEDIITVPLAEGRVNSNVEELRREYLDARLRYNRLVDLSGETHPQAEGLGRTIEDLREAIRIELEQATESARVSYNMARGREQALRRNLATMTDGTENNAALRGQLEQLEAIADTYAQVYRDYLARLEVTMQQQGFPIASVKVISPAEVPKAASSPQEKRMLFAGMLLGGFFGVMIGAARELAPKPLRTASAMRDEVGVPCAGLLPRAGGKDGAAARDRTLERLVQACEAGRQKPGGTITAIAAIGDGLADPEALPADLARRLAETRGRKVLLIDYAGKGFKAGDGIDNAHLVEVLERYAGEGAKVSVPDKVAADLRERYDHILVLLPPLDRATSAEPLAGSYDATILRVPWGRVLPDFVADGLRDHPRFRERLATTVLEGANLAKARRYVPSGSYEERETYA
ncbi:GumC family protein [Aestuariibius sp. 2305UL40-4]|uniref:GumC family protein n=1 Tax=Aestuariibius violaceus TaxID=3234132 RepID=UPI00345F0D9B